MVQSEQINEIVGALAKAQGEMKGVAKDSKNEFFKTQYATLASALDTCREPLSKNGLAVIQTTELSNDGNLLIRTTLAHSSGQFFSSIYPVNPVKNDPQGFGSAITYSRRYCLMAIVGIAPEDDDGEDASGRGAHLVKETRAVPPKPPKQAESPKPTTGPVDPEQEWADLAQKIKKDIDGATTASRLGDIIESRQLAEMNAHNEITGKFLRDRAEKKIGVIANGGTGKASGPQNSSEVPF